MNIIVVILNFCICFDLISFCATHNASKAEVGPYKAVLVRSERCKVPPLKPYDKNPISYFTSEIYTSGKRTLLRGNLTIARIDPQIWLSSKGYILTEDKYQVIYVASAVGCNGVLMRVFKFGLNVQHLKGCVPKGTYLYKDVDFNGIQQTWSKTTKYGSYLWRLQVGSRTGTSICWEYYTVTTPISD